MSALTPDQFLPYSIPDRSFKLKTNQYSTSQDPRGCIPVYEYEINGQPIMWDRENGHVHFTGIWKALNNSKADIVKIVDSNPELKVKKVRGGCLVIQGTWIPHEHAFALCARTAWEIRFELVPIFGPSFLDAVLSPGSRLHGCLVLNPLASSSHKVVAAKAKKVQGTSKSSAAAHPYKREQARTSRRAKTASSVKKAGTASSSMSVSRLLNDEEDRFLPMVPNNAYSSPPLRTPPQIGSPTFVRVAPLARTPSAFSPVDNYHQSFCRGYASSPVIRAVHSNDAPRMYNQTLLTSLPEITPIFEAETEDNYCPLLSNPLSPQDLDIIERVEAGILLQCLSQDFGRDPNHPLDLSAFPTRVRSGDNEYMILWN
ncbi:hypothetical protein BY458DRAFT_439293 [Sporodiniella umbellata]|nr:hypothetical protein BY458DRAFT_439293 [Sporodiniella umbellata]